MNFDVSVIVPTYNRAGFIGETLQSIFRQTLPPREVIVVDDGSTDNTEAVVREFGSRVRYIRIPNSGPANARKVGISLARCDWIALCDSDDLWLPEKLGCQAQLFKLAPEVQYCFTDFFLLTPKGRDSRTKFQQAPPHFWEVPKLQLATDLWVVTDPFFPHILKFQPIFPSCVTFAQEFYTRVGGFRPDVVDNWPAEDLEFTLRCTLQPPLGVVARPLVEIRKHPGGHSANKIRLLEGEIRILEYARTHYELPGAYCVLLEQQISLRSAAAAELAFAAGELQLVRELEPRILARHRHPKLHIKLAVVRLPDKIARVIARALVSASDLYYGLRGRPEHRAT